MINKILEIIFFKIIAAYYKLTSYEASDIIIKIKKDFIKK